MIADTATRDSLSYPSSGGMRPTLRVWRRLDIDNVFFDDYPASVEPLLVRYWEPRRPPALLPSTLAVVGARVQILTREPRDGEPAIYLTVPVLNATQDSAIVRVTDICGGLCGQGALLLMVRHPTRWRVARVLDVMFS